LYAMVRKGDTPGRPGRSQPTHGCDVKPEVRKMRPRVAEPAPGVIVVMDDDPTAISAIFEPLDRR